MGKSNKGPPTAVQIEVKKGRDLHDTSMLGKMDPYVEVTMGTKTQSTAVINKGGRFPTWNQTLTFTYNNESTLSFKVADKDMIGSDYIGCHDLHVGPIVQGARTFVGELALSRKKGKVAGYIDIAITFYGEVGAGSSSDSSKGKKKRRPLWLLHR
eukprot:Lankesteria_metandrocarpae@DN4805_c1_g1_i1.p1